MTSSPKSIFDPQKIRQEISTKLETLSKRNCRLWLIEQQKHLSQSNIDQSTRYRAIVSSIKLYTMFPTGKLGSDKAVLIKARKACDLLIAPTQELANLRYTLATYLGNIHIANNLFFEALEYFQDASECETDEENQSICLLNKIRCKLWLRDFRDVMFLSKNLSPATIMDSDLKPILVSLTVRLQLLMGDCRRAKMELNSLPPALQTIELDYLDLVAGLMMDWETSLSAKYEAFIRRKSVSDEQRAFYTLESAILSTLQDLKRGRPITSTVTRRLASFKNKTDDIHLQECTKVLLLFVKNQNASLSRKLSLHQRMSAALSQLLFGANDFMYQFASVFWLEYLWSKGQKTEFARYFIEFKGYAERLRFEINSTQDSSTFWLQNQINEFGAHYHKLI